MTFIFADSFLGIGEKLPLIFTVSIFAGLIAASIVYKLAGLMEKAHLFALSILLSAIALASMAFIQPGKAAIPSFMALTAVFTFCNAIILSIAPSMVSDIADYGSWKSRADHMATYFAIYLFMAKAIVGIGGALGLGLIGWYGFDAAATSHSETGVFGLRLAVIYIPAITFIAALPFALSNPISAHRHRVLQKRLALRRQWQQSKLSNLQGSTTHSPSEDFRINQETT